jgi:hypothetical protein
MMYQKGNRGGGGSHDTGICAVAKYPADAFNRMRRHRRYGCIKIPGQAIDGRRDLK